MSGSDALLMPPVVRQFHYSADAARDAAEDVLRKRLLRYMEAQFRWSQNHVVETPHAEGL